MTGLVVDESGFELLVGEERIGPRRALDPADVALLEGLAARYVRAVQSHADTGDFLELGRELYAWLDGDQGQLSVVLARASSPVVFEVQGPRSPLPRAWAVLRAPFELLAAPGGGFLAEDMLTRFCVVRRLGVAGQPPTPDGFRLGLAFMASSPRDQHELDFEAEESAILTAVGDTHLDLMVDDTGDPEQLGRRLAEVGGMPVVHLSCHGVNNWPRQPGEPGVAVLLMEDELGASCPTTAGELVDRLPVVPRLLFVSACLTATGADATGHLPPGEGHRAGTGSVKRAGFVAHSLATALVTAGVPAVLGWDGSVDDRAATLFAEQLYGRLAKQSEVAVAVGDARRVLMNSGDPVIHRDWHLARLWWGPTGGGKLVAGTHKRSLVSATHGTKTFLDRKQQAVPVATAEMFVGRRPELQQALRALRSGEHGGVLLHGQGRLGKSSLAARIADRCADRAVAVVFGDYSALGILDTIKAAVEVDPQARELVTQRLAEIRERPEAIGELLIDLVSGPCAQAGPGKRRPLLLIIDDLEQVLVRDPTGPHRVAPAHAPVLAAVLRAFDPARTDSRLLLTSRFTFALDGLESRLERVQLRPLSRVAQRKLQRRQQALTPTQRQAQRSALADRSLVVSRGNPGLQDLIGLRLVYGEQVSLERAEAVVAGMETYLRHGDLPADTDVRAFLENLALDALLQEAGPSSSELFRAVTLFDLPVPASVIDTLAGQLGGSPSRLQGLGLLDPYQDLHHPTRQALGANPLAAGRVEALTTPERTALAQVSAGALFTAWGAATPQTGRRGELDLQLTRLGLLADDPTVVAVCALGAVRELRSGRAAHALHLAQDTITLLDRHQVTVTLDLLRVAAAAALTSGDGHTGSALLDRAMHQVNSDATTGGDGLDQARVIGERARRLRTIGEPDQAEQLLRHAHELFTAAGSDGEAAAAMGEIADIAEQRGDYDEALRIRREVTLPVYERLGDTRETALTWGKIADIAYQRGDYDEALRIRREVTLPVYERLGDTRATAVTWGKIADIAYRRGDYDEALRIHREVELPVYERLGDTHSTTVTWGKIADIAERRGDYDEALRIHREVTLPVYERLGDTLSTAVTWGQIADIAERRGDYDEAAEMYTKAQKSHQQLGDLEGIASTHWGLARVRLAQQDTQSALPLLIESFQILRHLQRPDAIAVVGKTLGQVMIAAGRADEAREVLADSSAAATKIGQLDLANQIEDLISQLPKGDDAT